VLDPLEGAMLAVFTGGYLLGLCVGVLGKNIVAFLKRRR
jgi:hypothetical protein